MIEIAMTVIITLVMVVGVPKIAQIIRGYGVGRVSDDEKRVIETVPSRWRKDLLRYLRTLEASRALQDHMATNIPCLRAVSKFMKKEYGNIVKANPP